MSWRAKVKEFGGGDITFLSSDGETIMFIVVDEPVLLHGKFKGKEQDRIGCPVVTDEGFVLFITGKRVARKLSKFEERFIDTAFMITRHGVEGDINASYDVGILSLPEKTEQLFDIAKKEYKPAMLKAAIEDAKEAMKN
ncbi:unnamed protein product [marine sediment metagenome]|uniref:Uncharacterized protein n=1 Tax=marine sediment metagenome TaxID=412755 RepID=X1IUP5_9ZZZZ